MDTVSSKKHLSVAKKTQIAGACALIACVLWLVNYFVIGALIFPKAVQEPTTTNILVIVCAAGMAVFGIGQIIRQGVVSVLGGLLFVAGIGVLEYMLYRVLGLIYNLPLSWLLLAIGILIYGWVASPSDKGQGTKGYLFYLPAFCGLFAFFAYFPWALQLFSSQGAECILWLLVDALMGVAIGLAAWAVKPAGR